jgi:hypothetical protein
MPKDHRFLQPHSSETAVVVVVQVRPAHPSCRQTQAQLPRPDGFLGPLLDPQVFGRVNDDRPHHSTGVSRGWPAKCAVRLSRISLPIACGYRPCPSVVRLQQHVRQRSGSAGSGSARPRTRPAQQTRACRLPSASSRAISSTFEARLMLISIPSGPIASHHPCVDDVAGQRVAASATNRKSDRAASATASGTKVPPFRPPVSGAGGIGDLHAKALQPPAIAVPIRPSPKMPARLPHTLRVQGRHPFGHPVARAHPGLGRPDLPRDLRQQHRNAKIGHVLGQHVRRVVTRIPRALHAGQMHRVIAHAEDARSSQASGRLRSWPHWPQGRRAWQSRGCPGQPWPESRPCPRLPPAMYMYRLLPAALIPFRIGTDLQDMGLGHGWSDPA